MVKGGYGWLEVINIGWGWLSLVRGGYRWSLSGNRLL